MSLGTLAHFHPQIRRLIWSHFVYPRTPLPPAPDPHPHQLKQIHLDVTAELDRDCHRQLLLALHPDQDRIIVGNFPHLTLDEFRHTDFSIFKSIIVTIYSRDIRDPGQFVWVRTFVARLVTLLRKSQTLPDTEVACRKTRSALWYTNGVANNSLADLTLAGYFNGSDIEGLLDPFQTLRNMGRTKIQLPPGAEKSESVLQAVSCTETDIPHRPAFGGDCFRQVDIGAILLDMELDRLDGPTASIVRWERFRNWDEYYHDIRQTADRVKQYLRDVVDVEIHLLDVSNDYDWFSDFQLHPFPDEPTSSPEDPSRWNYPDGIPPKETLE